MTNLTWRDLLRLAGILGIAAAALSVYVSNVEAPIPGDLRVAREVQSWSRLADNEGIINGAHGWRWAFLGLAAALVLLRWRLAGGGQGPAGRPRDEALIAFAAAGVLGALNGIMKELVHSPRPLDSLGVKVVEFKSDYGFPSGHVYGNVLIYGVLAVMAPVWVHPKLVLPVRALCVALIVLSGPARVVVGAHWPSDTYGGYLWGGCALALALAFAGWAVSGKKR